MTDFNITFIYTNSFIIIITITTKGQYSIFAHAFHKTHRRITIRLNIEKETTLNKQTVQNSSI